MRRLLFALMILLGVLAMPVLADQCALGNETACAVLGHHDGGGADAKKMAHSGCCHVAPAMRTVTISLSPDLSFTRILAFKGMERLIEQPAPSPLLEPPSHA